MRCSAPTFAGIIGPEEAGSWRCEKQEKLDGINKVTEQVIGHDGNERHRMMGDYKRKESILHVSSLVGWLRMQRPGIGLSERVHG